VNKTGHKVFGWIPEETLFRFDGSGFVFKFVNSDNDFLYYKNGWDSKRRNIVRKIEMGEILTGFCKLREWRMEKVQ